MKINKKGFVDWEDWDSRVINIIGGVLIVAFVAVMGLVLIAIISNDNNFC